MSGSPDEEDAFGAELVEQDDGKSNTTSQQVTPRAQNLAPQSFSYQNTSSLQQQQQQKNSNTNNYSLNPNTGRVDTADPSSSSPHTGASSVSPTGGGARKSPRTRGEGHFASVHIVDDNDNNNMTMTRGGASASGALSNSRSGVTFGSGYGDSSASMFGHQTTSSAHLLSSSVAPGGAKNVPGQHPNMYLSFSMIPGRKSVMSTTSNVSTYFDRNGNAISGGGGGGVPGGPGSNMDDDSRRATPAPGMGSDKDLNKKKLPQPIASMSEIEEELQSELLRCVTEQTSSCNLSRLQIQRIPQEIRCFSWLRELLLGDNNISILPDTIFLQMQSLEVLDLMENKLVTVPRSVFQLRSLKKILLDHNKIANLPDDIDPDPVEQFGLPELIEVGLEWNSLQQFPINFLIYAPKLERMFLSENPGISTLPRPNLIEERKKKIHIRLDNRPMLLQAAQSNPVYFASTGYVALEWNKIYPDRVLDFLYLGSMRTAQCVEVYQDLDIGYVLTAARNLDVVLGPGMKHLTLPFDDLPGEDISHFFETSFKFIDEAVANKKGILIHCFAGLSRSVAMTMGYLMKKFKIGADDALALIKQSRPSAHPNDGFVVRLRDYTRELGIDPEESKKVKAELEKRNHKNIATTTAGATTTSSTTNSRSASCGQNNNNNDD